MSAPRRAGFTLIELSIVLVIVGLLVGGILAGKALIQQAEVRAAASQLQKMETAYNTFRLKYNCIMGDCINATDFFGMNYVVVSGGCPTPSGVGNGNGNGDGLIQASPSDAAAGDWPCESAQAMKSLLYAGLVSIDLANPCGSGNDDFPFFKGINNSCAYFYNDDLFAQVTLINTNSMTWTGISADGSPSPALSPVQARLIDEKIDDGKPATGTFRGLDAALPSGGAIVPHSCSTSGTYNLNEDFTCRSLYYFE